MLLNLYAMKVLEPPCTYVNLHLYRRVRPKKCCLQTYLLIVVIKVQFYKFEKLTLTDKLLLIETRDT